MKRIELDFSRVDRIIEYALREDLGDGDVTTNSLATEKKDSKAVIRAKARGVIAGLPIAKRVFQKLDPTVVCVDNIGDGEDIKPGDILSEINGGTRALLSGERLALNILQRLSGIATLTSKYVKAVEGLPVKILDTRKTAPGLRILDKYAVSVGGGFNHRFGLFDGVLIKDNHIAIAGGIQEAVAVIRKKYKQKYKIEVETSDLEQVKEALIAGADIIMLDNMSPEQMRKAVRLIDRNALVEA
ncbi:MAG TPA: carboxylating nicotinate-nucleotide diphosphorylase, partial [Thermodesulfobacteriota bacterium]|nr:carboxylating nicotinate-nucleotide diphosphorylase [Thermodesulfobacteriota bacterium]